MIEVIFKKTTYDYETLSPVVFDMLESFCGHLVKKNTKVLIKPNFLLPAEPDRAITTHPLVVKAASEYVLSKGGRVQISDSPARSFKKVIRNGGYITALKDVAVEFKEFEESVKVEIGEPFGRIDIAKDAVEADVVINLAKLKTHAQMLLTLGVKNMFGCIPGLQKPKWHYRAGVDRDIFAELLVQIYKAVSPSVTLVDGILAMEGQGPGKSGTPRRLGFIVGGRDGIAVDKAICSMLGLASDKLPTNRAALKLGFGSEGVHIQGDATMIKDFRLPDHRELKFGPWPLHGIMRKYLFQRPVSNKKLCKLCGECWTYCPAEAITPDSEKVNFDYDRCIRCYCCIEICPYGALLAKDTFPGRLLNSIITK